MICVNFFQFGLAGMTRHFIWHREIVCRVEYLDTAMAHKLLLSRRLSLNAKIKIDRILKKKKKIRMLPCIFLYGKNN
jgi:hypothetical protein